MATIYILYKVFITTVTKLIRETVELSLFPSLSFYFWTATFKCFFSVFLLLTSPFLRSHDNPNRGKFRFGLNVFFSLLTTDHNLTFVVMIKRDIILKKVFIFILRAYTFCVLSKSKNSKEYMHAMLLLSGSQTKQD